MTWYNSSSIQIHRHQVTGFEFTQWCKSFKRFGDGGPLQTELYVKNDYTEWKVKNETLELYN